MIRPIFEDFLQGHKTQWLTKKALGKEPKPELIEQAELRYDAQTWMANAIKNARRGAATHVSTYSHPDAKTTNIMVDHDLVQNGLIMTSNVNCRNAYDIYGNAGTDSSVVEIYGFLNMKGTNGLSIIEHLSQNTDDIQTFFQGVGVDYAVAKERLELMLNDDKPTKTHKFVKQVYFPVSDDQYHLLSILTSSVLQTEVFKRINELKFSEINKELRTLRKEKKYSDQALEDIYGLTEVFYGGSKPQNISVANSLNRGKAYLIDSLPPTLEKRTLRLPKHDFFETLFYKSYQDSFLSMHELMAVKVNNMYVRDGIKNTIQFIIDQVLFKALTINQSMPEGWSDDEAYAALPKYQKILLDSQYDHKEFKTLEWREMISKSLGHWLVKSYEKSVKDAFLFETSEYNFVKDMVEETLRQDKGMF